MSKNENTNLPIGIDLLDEKKNIVTLNSENETILSKITKELEADKYNSIVTMENYKVMKESATELNKTAQFINRFKIDKVKAETKDIEVFKENCKTYQELIQEKRDIIKDGLNVFEEETRKQVLNVCSEYLKIQIETNSLREEFANIDVSDMTQTGYMTSKGLISKKGKDEVESRVNTKLALQNKVDMRLMNLENECLKNGIAPMSKEYIQGFLYEDDAVYQEKLNALIQIEVKRAEQEKARLEAEAKVKAEKEAKEKVLAEQKALKDELHARYESLIKSADMPNLTRINIELKSYDDSATYELRQLSKQRETELLAPKEEVQEVDEAPQIEHMKAIQEEKPKEEKKSVDGKVEKTLSIKIRVPGSATDEQVVSAVINMIKADKLPIENFEVV